MSTRRAHADCDWFYVRKISSLKYGAAAVSVVALGLTLAACGGSGSSNPFPVKGGAPATAGPGSAPASGAAAGANGVVSQAGQGARLDTTISGADIASDVESALSWLPSGFTVVISGGSNSGPQVLANKFYDIPKLSCVDLAQEYGGAGFGEQAYYSNSALSSDEKSGYEWAVYEFPSASDAQSFVKDLAAKFASCGQFSGKNDVGAQVSGTYTIGPASAAQVPLADTSFDAHVQVTSSQTANADLVAAADGNVVVFGGPVALSSSTLPSAPSAAQVVQNIMSAIVQGAANTPATSDVPTSTVIPQISIPPLPSVGAGAGQ